MDETAKAAPPMKSIEVSWITPGRQRLKPNT
jgi:hypothetical protein